MAKRGGKRIDAGRPVGSKASHTILAQEFRKLLIERISEEAAPIIEALIARAKTGDMQAIKEANERVIGKVKDTTELNIQGLYTKTTIAWGRLLVLSVS